METALALVKSQVPCAAGLWLRPPQRDIDPDHRPRHRPQDDIDLEDPFRRRSEFSSGNLRKPENLRVLWKDLSFHHLSLDFERHSRLQPRHTSPPVTTSPGTGTSRVPVAARLIEALPVRHRRLRKPSVGSARGSFKKVNHCKPTPKQKGKQPGPFWTLLNIFFCLSPPYISLSCFYLICLGVTA